METARKYVVNAVDQLHGLPEKSIDPYVVGYGPQAEKLAAQIETRLNSPFFWRENQGFIFAQPGQETGIQRLVLQFKTAPKAELELSCANPAVRLEPAVADAKQPLQRVVFLSFDAAKFDFAKAKASTMAEIVARSPEFPAQEAHLPVQIYVPKPEAQEVPN